MASVAQVYAAAIASAVALSVTAAEAHAGQGQSILLPASRLPYYALLKGEGEQHACDGVIVGPSTILTSATCIEAVGPNPIAVINAFAGDKGDRGWTDAQGLLEERWVERWWVHPSWEGNRSNGYDAALLKLDKPVNISRPTLAAPTLDLQPNLVVCSPQQAGLDIRLSCHVVVDGRYCTRAEDVTDGRFCMHPCGSHGQGTAMVILHSPQAALWAIERGWPDLDLLVGICPCCNLSLCSGGCMACVLVSHLRPWLQTFADQQEDWVPW